jgi:putative restriction endonuclease
MTLPASIARFRSLNVWKRGAERAPHKPLLILCALARLTRGDREPLLFEELEPKLRELLQDFGPRRQSYHPEYPFWHLQSDDVWELAADDQLSMRVSSNAPPKGELIRHHARGRFATDVLAAFDAEPARLSCS